MNHPVKKIVLAEQQAQAEENLINKNYLGLVSAIEVQCTVRVGTLKLTIAQLKELRAGQTLQLDQKTNEPVEIMLNEKVIARGELMCYDNNFAIQITETAC